MKINRTKNSVDNIFTGMIAMLICKIAPFLCRTVFIHTLGAQYLGLSSLFSSVLSVLSLADLGFGSALVFSMYKPIAEDDVDTMCALLKLYRKVYHIVGTVILVAGLAVLPFIPHLIANKTYPSDINIYVIYIIYLVGTCISYFMYAYKTSLIGAHQRSSVSNKVGVVMSILTNLVQILILVATHNFYAYVVIGPCFTIINNLVMVRIVNKMFPQYECRGKVKPEMMEDIKKRVKGLIVYKIYGVIFSSVDTIVISAFLGLSMLAAFSNYNLIIISVVGFLEVIKTSITAGIGNSIVVESVEKNYNDFKKLVFMNGWIVSWSAICMLCLYQHFMKMWAGTELMLGNDTMVLMVLYFFLPRVTTMTYQYREAAGLWYEDRYRPLVSTAVNLTVNLILVNIIGINGVIISTLICTVFINVPWGSYVLFKKYFNRSAVPYYLRMLYYVFCAGIVGVVTYFACSFLPEDGIISFLLKGIICLIVPNILLLIIYRRRSEFKESKVLVKRIMNDMTKKLRKKI